MVSFGEKAIIKTAGNLNQGHSYVNTTVQDFSHRRSEQLLKHNIILLVGIVL